MNTVNATSLSYTASNEMWSIIPVTVWGVLTCVFTMDI